MYQRTCREGGCAAELREKKLNFRFHDPNSEARTAEYILELFFEVDREKVEMAIQAADFDDPELFDAGLADFEDGKPAAKETEEGSILSL